jgi:hypothetical protein
MSRWPLWRLLVWVEAWLLSVTAFHLVRPVHEAFVVPLLIAIIPGTALVIIRSFARAATDHKALDQRPARLVELAIGGLAVAVAGWWTVQWALQARDDLRRVDAILGQATIVVDVSLTGLSMVACFAALTLDWFLATAHQPLRETMHWLRRTHIAVTVAHVCVLIGSAWAVTNWPGMTDDSAAFFQRARIALHVYEYARATIFPVQAVFAALAVLVVALDSRTGG